MPSGPLVRQILQVFLASSWKENTSQVVVSLEDSHYLEMPRYQSCPPLQWQISYQFITSCLLQAIITALWADGRMRDTELVAYGPD